MDAEWVERMRDVPVAQLASELGYRVGEKPSAWHISPCPACGAERRHPGRRDKRGAVGSKKSRAAGWHCHACGVDGDSLHFLALHLHGRRMGELDEPQRAAVRAWCVRFLGLDGEPARYQPPPEDAPRGPVYPDAAELAQIWGLSGPVSGDPQIAAWLRGRAIDPERVDALELARALPRDAELPEWAGFGSRDEENWRPWTKTQHRLLLPLYSPDGVMRSVIARTIDPRRKLKGVSPTGYDRAGLLLADGVGVGVLNGERSGVPGERIVIAEGEMDLLCWATERDDAGHATWGIVSGSWTDAVAARVPEGAVVVIATDHDEPNPRTGKREGDEYAAKIIATLRARLAAGEVILERWKPAAGTDANEARQAGEALEPTGEPIAPPEPRSRRKKKTKKRRKPSEERPPPRDDELSEEDVAFLAGIGGFNPGDRLLGISRYAKAPIPEGLRIPFGYRLDEHGAVWTNPPEGARQRPRRIAYHVPLLRRILLEPATQEERLEVVFERRGSWRTAIIERSIISVGGRDTARALGAVGAPIEPNTARDVAQWVARLESANERQLPYAQVSTRSGWHELEDGERVFLLGGEVLGLEGAHDGVVFDERVDVAGVARHVRVHGSAEAHREVLARGMAASDSLACGVYAALAAPLLHRIGAPSFAYHFVGPSSRGKTTSLGISAGLYGSPEVRGGQGWVASWDSTSVGLEHRAMLSSDLPLCLDEAGLVSPEQREHDVYMLVSGQGRTRGAARGGLRQMAAWRTVVISTGEDQLVRNDRSRAGAQVRVVQVRVEGLGALSGQQVADLGSDSREHYGHLGRAWITKLAALRDFEPLRERYRVLMKAYRARLARRSMLEQRQAEAFGALALAEELAHHWLGLQAPGAVARLADDDEDRVSLVPEWFRALRVVNEWIASEPGAFPELELDSSGAKHTKREGGAQRPASRFAGFYDEHPGIGVAGGPKRVLCLVPDVVAHHLDERGLSLDLVARGWKAEGVLIPDDSPKQRLRRRVRIGGIRSWYYVVDVDALERVLGGEAGITPSGSDPSSGGQGSQRTPAEPQLNLGGGITGIPGITGSEHTRAGARAPARETGARARTRALSRSGDPRDPSDPSYEKESDSAEIGWDHPGITDRSAVIPAGDSSTIPTGSATGPPLTKRDAPASRSANEPDLSEFESPTEDWS